MSRDLNILYHSASPWIPTGYGQVTQEVLPRLQNLGYNVALQPMNAVHGNPIQWHGEIWDNGDWITPVDIDKPITIYPADSQFGLNEVGNSFNDFNADVLFTHFDTWMDPARSIIPNLDVPYISYVIVDHYPVPNKVIDQVSNAYETVNMSKFAKRGLEEKGIRSRTIPHGVNTDIYRPLEDEDVIPEAIKVGADDGVKEINIRDKFLFGIVAANMGDRKNIPNHMEAYRMFLDWVDDPDNVYMYIHTDFKSQTGYDFYEIQQELDIPDDKIIWGHAEEYQQIGDERLNRWYNAFDVLINCTYGESWGLTVTESMSAGTPVIASAYSSMPEQLGVKDPFNMDEVKSARYDTDSEISWEESTGSRDLHNWSMAAAGNVYEAPHGILVQPSVPVWRSKVSSKLYIVHPHDIFQAMKFYYQNPDLINDHSDKGREYVLNNYKWDEHIISDFDDLFSEMEIILS